MQRASLRATFRMAEFVTKRLGAGDRDLARNLFATMSDVFAEEHSGLSDRHIDRLLGDHRFWAIAALSGDTVVGGITAHTLPMTNSESAELFVYDIAIRARYRRRGVGRMLVRQLRASAAEAGVLRVCIPAEMDDLPALEFYRALGGAETAVAHFVFGPEDP